jgi:hypothetical protein
MWLHTPEIVTKWNYDKIRPGMTLAEVVHILGVPSNDLPPLSYEDIYSDESQLWKYPPPHEIRFWDDGTFMITIVIDSNGYIAAKSFSRGRNLGLIRRILNYLGF